MGRPDPLTGVALVVALAVGLPLTGCAGAVSEPAAPASVSTPTMSPSPSDSQPPSPGPAREGTRAPSQVDRFVPTQLVLPGRARAEVVPVATVDGELQVPKHVDQLGWWDGSAWLGDPFGSTVIAGHVDSATEGVGFFAQLLGIDVGQQVRVGGSKGRKQTYEVTSVRTVRQNALATDGRALDQTGDHRLVLITCTGAYTPGQGYESNLVVTARQVAPQK